MGTVDIAENQQEIARLKDELELLTSTSTDVVYRLRYRTMRYDYVSPSATRLLGFEPEAFKKINLRSLILETRVVSDTLNPVESFEALEDTRKRGKVLKWQADYLMRTKDGRKVWISDISYPWFDEKGAIIGSIGTLRDISDRVAAEEKARKQLAATGQRDRETGLRSHEAFLECVTGEVNRLKRSKADIALMALTLEGKTPESFRNDVRKIAGCLREVDVLARTGTRELAVLLPETSLEGAFHTAERLHALIEPEAGLAIGLSSVAFDHARDADELLKMAESRRVVSRHAGHTYLPTAEPMNVH